MCKDAASLKFQDSSCHLALDRVCCNEDEGGGQDNVNGDDDDDDHEDLRRLWEGKHHPSHSFPSLLSFECDHDEHDGHNHEPLQI